MYPWQRWQPWQHQASHYPPAPPQQAAVGAFFGPSAVTTGFNYRYHFPQPQQPQQQQQQVVCGICGKPIRWGEPQCHFPPWNANGEVGSGGGDGNGTEGGQLPAITLHKLCGKGARALGRPDLYLISPATIRSRYGKSIPGYRNPTDAAKAAIRRSRRCLLEFNGFETPILYHIEGEIVPLVEEELAKRRTRTKRKKDEAAAVGGDVATAPVGEEQRQKENEGMEIDDEAVAVLAAIATEEEGEEEECRGGGNDGDASFPASDEKSGDGSGEGSQPPNSPLSRKRKQQNHGDKERSKSPPSKHHGEQSKSPSSAAAAAKVRKRKQTSFLWEEQAKEWARPKNPRKATGHQRLQEKISTLHDKYVCTKDTLDRVKRRNEELQARIETTMVAFPRPQRESLIAYAKAAIGSDRGEEVRRAIERFRDEEIRFMNVSMEELIGTICDNDVAQELEANFIGGQDAGKGEDTNRDETNAKEDANEEETNRNEKEAKEDTNLSEKEAKEDRKVREEMDCNETEAKEEADVVKTVPDERKEERIIFI